MPGGRTPGADRDARSSWCETRVRYAKQKTSIDAKLPFEPGSPMVGVAALLRVARWKGARDAAASGDGLERTLRRSGRPTRAELSAATPTVAHEQGREATLTTPMWAQLPEAQRVRLVTTLGRMVQASRERRTTDE